MNDPTAVTDDKKDNDVNETDNDVKETESNPLAEAKTDNLDGEGTAAPAAAHQQVSFLQRTNEVSDLNCEGKKLQSKLEEQQKKASDLKRELEGLKQICSEKESKGKELQSRLEEQQKTESHLKCELEGLKQICSEKESKGEELQSTVNGLQKQLSNEVDRSALLTTKLAQEKTSAEEREADLSSDLVEARSEVANIRKKRRHFWFCGN
ncbi:MAG: hypothetical protein SGARI_001536 [Bacillariaceae sp.]